MSKYQIVFEGELFDEIYDSYEEAEDAAYQMCSDAKVGAEILHMSNLENEYDEDKEYDFDIIEVD